jgi:hypothetical protein
MNKNSRRRLEKIKREAKGQKSKGTLSISEKKNMQMVVHHQDGYSITKFEPCNPGRRMYKRTFGKTKSHA